jgi:hypothetical protein
MKTHLLRPLGFLAMALTLHAQAETQAPADAVALWDSTWAQYKAMEAVPLDARGYVSVSQDLSIVIKAPLKKVFRIYSDVNNAIGLHPFLKSIVPVRHIEMNCVPTYDFIAYEDIPMADGSIFHGVTVAQQRFFAKQHYYDADSFDVPGIVTHQHITFTRVPGGTQVTEHLTFEAPPLYITQTVQGGVYAHTQVQVGLKQKIESGAFKDDRSDYEHD